ncbi:MAG: dephospho-CoA kinase [Thermodesulfovibrionales bacterium]|nr:dephospho-CoA kinase [Thermodesulfovibrionales bacterium]
MVVVGLTGNYGMGKSTVAKIFRELGAITIDTDEIVADLLNQQEIIHQIKETFGEEVVKGGIVDKKLLANIVFSDPTFRIRLEDILHPKIFKLIDERIKTLSDSSIVVIEAPLIFERGYQNRFDIIITVYTSLEQAIQRLREKGISEDEARLRLNNQFPIKMKVDKSDYSVDNSKTYDYTREQVMDIYQKLTILNKINRNN